MSGMTVLSTVQAGAQPVVLRRAREDDLRAIVGLLADDYLGATRDPLPADGDLAPYQRAFGQIAADPAHLLVVGEADGEVVATIQLSFLPGLARRGALRAQVEAVRVRADFQGNGLGAAIMTWVIDESRRRGCALIQLSSDKTRTRAHRFYERLGFAASHKGMKLTL